jgi:Flp pilus assembly protein TadG
MQHIRAALTLLRARGPRKTQGGQGLVEFALILPFVVVMFFGIIQFGFLFGGQIALVNAVREATRYASTSPVNSNPTSQITNAVARGVPGYTGAATVAYSYCYYQDPLLNPALPTYSTRIHVSVTYGHPLFVPLVGSVVDGLDANHVIDNKFTVVVGEDMRVESQPYKSVPAGLSLCTTP